ncbi:hypothetical protein T492DRAFT_585579 [Pavlovales sp. CCMP2436]|nr:hypothetical protein T492DRAFT_585579 [Pavlovales sp. CCMP2436]
MPNWIKFEQCMDLVLPPSRRGDTNAYCRSVHENARLGTLNNAAAHKLIAAQTTRTGLAGGLVAARYFKLNLQNLVRGNQNTLEFRGHGGSCDAAKIEFWVRFLNAFVEGYVKYPPGDSFADGRSERYMFDRMFEWVVRTDWALCNHYEARIRDFL